MATPVTNAPTQVNLDWSDIRAQAGAYITTEYASLDRNGAPVTWPVTPYVGPDGATIDVSTGLSYPLKAERARRNPKVTLGFSEPLGSALDHPATFIVQGMAAVRDADLRANSARYLAESSARFPEVFAGMPTPVLRRMAFYWSRIWIEVTPTRVLWWADGDLDRAPLIWNAPSPKRFAESDPAPEGRGAGSWRTAAQVAWQKRTRGALERLGMPVLTTVTADGWPLPVRVRAADRTRTGFRLRPAAGIDIAPGPACLTFHVHSEVFESQENIGLIGQCRPIAGGGDRTVEFVVDRALNDFGVPRNPLRRMAHMASAGRRLSKRLDAEARRRGQSVPLFSELGYP